MKIIQQRERVQCVEYAREFFWRGETGWGFSFPCDEDGVIAELCEEGIQNLRKCLDGTHDVVDQGLQERRWSYWQSRIGKCDCGEEVFLDHFTNHCNGCNADYNSFGQRLADRSQWGEETVESLADILRIP